MPALSPTMEEGTLAKWLISEGDTISSGDLIAEIETDKATMEFESFYDGTLLHIEIQEGVPASVDSLLCIIGDEESNDCSLTSDNKNRPATPKPKLSLSFRE